MANWGIGLGGLAKGYESGVELASKMRGTPEEQRQARAADTADTARTDFDAQGGGTEDQFQQYLLPRVAAKMVAAGDLDGAKAWQGWATEKTNQVATKQFSQGMIAAQAGDMKGALDLFVKAGNTKGYGADYKFGEPQPTEGGGFAVSITAPGGKTYNKEFKSADDVLKTGATYFNPEAAFNNWQAQQQDATKRKNNLTDDASMYGTRKDIDVASDQKKQALGLGPANYEPQNVVQTGPDGKPVVKPYVFDKRKGTASQMTDADGNEISGEIAKPSRGGAGGVAKEPAEVATAKWLVQNKIAPDEQAAWSMVRTSRSNPQAMATQVYNSALKANYGDAAKAQKTVQDWQKFTAAPPAAATPAAPAPAQDRPDMMTPGNGQKPANIAVPQRPAAVPAGSAYSPSRQMWRTPDGKVFDANGNAVAQ